MKIAIIGGGAAGMMAASALAEVSAKNKKEIEIYLIEKTPSLGQKVLLSGGGRCNLTTGLSDLRLISERYPRGGTFLLSALKAFSPQAVYEWFESHGVPLKVEKDLRVFPVSDSGEDILQVFETVFKKHEVTVLLGHAVKSIEKIHTEFELHFQNRPVLRVDKVILTTGGQAYRHTGSSGDGYSFAEHLGHSITQLVPSLSSFLTADSWMRSLQGVALSQVALVAKSQKTLKTIGPILFTHHGITGPVVFALSSLLAHEECSPQRPIIVKIDFFPNLSYADLEKEMKMEWSKNAKKLLRNAFPSALPKSLTSKLCILLSINPDKFCSETSKKELAKLIENLKSLPLTLIGRAAGEEFVTAGGVQLTEIDPKTMESKICPNLYFAGEILDIDGFTGGYNLQAAWCTGFRAGESATTVPSLFVEGP